MADARKELTFEILKGRAQFAYFQMGLAASAIAFTINETKNQSLKDTPYPIGIGVLLWAISIACGCFGEDARLIGMNTNIAFLTATDGLPPKHMQNEPTRNFVQSAMADTQTALNKAPKQFQRQLWALFAGAIFYLAGHIMHMSAIPPVIQCAHTATMTCDIGKAPPVAAPSPSRKREGDS